MLTKNSHIIARMTDCIIIGGGLIGMLTARALLNRGMRVSILERGPFGREASWAGGGILSPLYPWRYHQAVNALSQTSQSLYPPLVEDVAKVSGIDPEWRRCGLCILDVHDTQQASQWAKNNQLRLDFINPSQLTVYEPALARLEQDAVYLPDIAQIRNPRFIKAMQTYLHKRGVSMHADTEVAEIVLSQQAVQGVKTIDGQLHRAERVVIANGAWSGRLLRQMHIDLQIHPVRGQMLLLRTIPGLLRSVILHKGRYLVPRSDGRIVVGSTMEQVGFDKSTTLTAQMDIKRFAESVVPALQRAEVEQQWAGLRPGCGQGIPYIGEHPEIRGLFVNAGHFRNGISMAPASAELLAASVMAEKTLVPPEPYALAVARESIA